jgi:hypothetical protein
MKRAYSTLYRTIVRHLRDTGPGAVQGPTIRLDDGFRPSASPAFARAVLDDYARSHGLRTWDSFCMLHASPEAKRPKKPSDERIEFQVRQRGYDAKTTELYRTYLTHTAGADYISAYEQYEKDTERREHIVQNFPLCDSGYVSLFCDENPQFRDFFFEQYRKLPISESARERHTYITGGTGSGKTEAIKVLIHHYVKRYKTAVVVIEPHGDLAQQVAQWREFRDDPDRLVYIDPAIDSDNYTPIFNPLDIPDSERAPLLVNKTAKEIVEVFKEILQKDFSPNMGTLLTACIATLLLRNGSTLRDLIRFLDTDNNDDLIAFAKKNLRGELSLYRQFFEEEFFKDSLNLTKQSVKMRLYSFLPGFFERVTVGKSTFDFEGALRARKVVIFNLSKTKLGESESAVLGRFIMARLKSFAFDQGRIEDESKRVPVHAFIDECQNYITPSIEVILNEARKYRVHLTLAQQILGYGMDTETRKAVLSNTAVKITGRNARHTLDAMAKETDAPIEELERLQIGEFHIKSWARKSVKVHMPTHRLKTKGAMSADEWEAVRADQIARYYKPLTQQAGETANETEKPKTTKDYFGFNPDEML